MLIDRCYAATLRFRNAQRAESRSFVKHLGPKHQFKRVMVIYGDRESEVRYLAEQVGITEIYAQKSPEEKLTIVQQETNVAKAFYVGGGVNDASAMMAATVAESPSQHERRSQHLSLWHLRTPPLNIPLALSAFLSHLLFWYAFASIWCFFAAILSVYLGSVFYRLPVRQY